jgi:hypothetical protein
LASFAEDTSGHKPCKEMVVEADLPQKGAKQFKLNVKK